MNITELVSVRAREIPDAPAVLTAESTLSYGELDRAVSWTATLFKKAGLAEGDIVAIQLSNQAQHFITSLALARLGAGQIAFDGTNQHGSNRILSGGLKSSQSLLIRLKILMPGRPVLIHNRPVSRN